MKELEFFLFVLEHPLLYSALALLLPLLLYAWVRPRMAAGVLDPFTLAFPMTFGINYAAVVALYVEGRISHYLFWLMLAYAVVFVIAFRHYSVPHSREDALQALLRRCSEPRNPRTVLAFSMLLLAAVSLYILIVRGAGLFADTNRFDASRGVGAFIRIFELLALFLTCWATVATLRSARHRVLKTVAILLFAAFSAIVNGAKLAVIATLFSVALSLVLAGVSRTSILRLAVPAAIIGLLFSVLALGLNLELNQVDADAADSVFGLGFLAERFVYRVIASGNTSYHLLPDNLIDTIAVDNIFARLAAGWLGISLVERLLGYPVGDLTVGRQALLIHDPLNEVAGGPTSHFDLFSYVYLGPVGGLVGVLLMARLLGSISSGMHRAARRGGTSPASSFTIAFYAAVWSRITLIVVEPPVALGYLIDALLYFTVVPWLLYALRPKRAPRSNADHITTNAEAP